MKLDTVLEHDDGKFLWFHPRVAVIPKLGRDGQPAPGSLVKRADGTRS